MFEANERILPTESKQIASTLKNELTQRGVTFHEDVQLDENSIQKDDDGVTIHFGDNQIHVESFNIYGATTQYTRYWLK